MKQPPRHFTKARGSPGGLARASSLTPEQRSEIARKGGNARQRLEPVVPGARVVRGKAMVDK